MGEIPHMDYMAVPVVLAAAVANVPAFMQILKTGEWLFYLPCQSLKLSRDISC